MTTDTDQGVEIAVTEWLATWQTLTIIVQREPACVESTAELLPLEQEEEGKQ